MSVSSKIAVEHTDIPKAHRCAARPHRKHVDKINGEGTGGRLTLGHRKHVNNGNLKDRATCHTVSDFPINHIIGNL